MSSAADIRDAVLLSGAVLFGAFFIPVLPFVGVPLAAAGLAALIHRGRATTATFAAGMAVAFGAFLQPTDVIMLAPVLVALFVFVGSMGTRSPLASIVPLTAVVALGSAGAAAAEAALTGETILGLVRERVDGAVEMFATAAGGLQDDGTISGVDPQMLADTMYQLWPVDFFATALISATLGVAVAGWAAGRVGADVRRLPRLDVLDLSPHVLWPFIAAFALMAAGRVLDDPRGWITAAGLNLLIGVRMVLLAQGLGVVSAFYRRIGLGTWARRSGYAILFLADMFLPAVSVVGLIDFWANFRKLPREDTPSAEGPEEGLSDEE